MQDFNELKATSIPASLTTVSAEPVVIEAADAAETAGPKKFSGVAYTGGPMNLRGFVLPVVVDLQGLRVPNPESPVLRQHDENRPVGHTIKVDISAQRIRIDGKLSGVGADTDHIEQSAAKGYPWQLSIGTSVEKAEHVDRGQSVKVNGRNFSGPLIVVRAATWREVSFVTLGADNLTSATIAANLGFPADGMAMTFDEYLAKLKVEAKDLSAEALNALRAQYKAEQSPPSPAPAEKPAVNASESKPNSIPDEIEAQSGEDRRQEEIEELVAKMVKGSPSKVDELRAIGDQAIEDKWSTKKTAARLLVASIAQAAPLVYSTSRGDMNAKVVEASFAKGCNLQNIEKHYDDKTLDASDKNFGCSGIGIQELIGLCAEQLGFRGSVKRNLKGAMLAAFRVEASDGGPSTYSLPTMLGSILKKSAHQYFMNVDGAYALISKKKPVSDFKTITSFSLTGDLEYVEVAKGGQVQYGSVGEETWTNRAKLYAKAFAMTYVDLRNDDSSSFDNLALRLGRGARLKINSVFWSTLLGAQASGYFSADNGNYDSGTDTAFDSNGLTNAYVLWNDRVNPVVEGDQTVEHPLGVMPKYLVVPTALFKPAKRLMSSERTTADSDEGDANVHAGDYSVVTSPYMNKSAFTGASAKAWYLFADPNDIPAVEICYLDGAEEPIIDTFDMDVDLNITARGRHAFGVAMTNPAAGGAYKFKGEA